MGFTDYDEIFQPLLSHVEILETQGVFWKCSGEERIHVILTQFYKYKNNGFDVR